MLTGNNQMSEWAKVKVAAVIGVTVPWFTSLFEKAGPILDILIKLGQIGVAIVTILYIWSKWKKISKTKNE